MPMSKQKTAVAEVLRQQGYIRDVAVEEIEGKAQLAILLRYFEGKPVIEMLRRVSRPGLRVYKRKDDSSEGDGRSRNCNYFHIEGFNDRSPGPCRWVWW